MTRSTRKRVTRDQWLSKALEMFAKTGEEGLHVEKISRALAISKSGFYFHFSDREDFLQQLLAYWAHEYTEVVSMNPLLLMTPARQRLSMIATLVFEQNLTEFDVAMQVWSNKDPKIARQVRKVVNMRMAFTRKAFVELGFEGDDLEMRARMFIALLTSERQLFGPSKKLSERYRESTLAMLTQGTSL